MSALADALLLGCQDLSIAVPQRKQMSAVQLMRERCNDPSLDLLGHRLSDEGLEPFSVAVRTMSSPLRQWARIRPTPTPEIFQPSIPVRQAPSPGIAVFHDTGHVVVNRYGAFVPQSLFGENAQLWHQLSRNPDGTPFVIIGTSTPPQAIKPHTIASFDSEQRWLADHAAEYAGQWVALAGDRVIAHGLNARDVYEAADKAGVELPLVILVEQPDQLPFAGW